MHRFGRQLIISLAFLEVSGSVVLEARAQHVAVRAVSRGDFADHVKGANAVRGTAVDRSGGVLPGVTVTATASDGKVLATTVSDEAGQYSFDALPVGRVSLTFQLDGFGTATVQLVVQPGAEIDVLERLDLAPLAETVVVQGRAPVAPPPPPPPLVLTPVPAHDQESVCGPAKAGATTESFGTIRSRRHEAEPALYAKGDELIIGGTFAKSDVAKKLGAFIGANGHSGVKGAAAEAVRRINERLGIKG